MNNKYILSTAMYIINIRTMSHTKMLNHILSIVLNDKNNLYCRVFKSILIIFSLSLFILQRKTKNVNHSDQLTSLTFMDSLHKVP